MLFTGDADGDDAYADSFSAGAAGVGDDFYVTDADTNYDAVTVAMIMRFTYPLEGRTCMPDTHRTWRHRGTSGSWNLFGSVAPKPRLAHPSPM